MEALRQYIISVVAAGLICGVVTGLFPGGTGGSIMKLVCGVFLCYTVLAPVSRIELEDLAVSSWTLADGSEAVAAGEQLSEQARDRFIKQDLEAYILDKASQLGADLQVEVALEEGGLPCAVTLTGQIAPYQRQQLERFLTLELGIAKENQQWTG